GEVTPTAAATPTTAATPTASPVPTKAPVEIPADLPTVSFDHMKELIDKAITDESAYVYEEKTTFSGTDSYQGRCYDLESFPKFSALDAGIIYTEELCYMDENFNTKKQVFTLVNGKQATLYRTAYGNALDYADTGREYDFSYDTDVSGNKISYYEGSDGTTYSCLVETIYDTHSVSYEATYDKNSDALLNYRMKTTYCDDQGRITGIVISRCTTPGEGYDSVDTVTYTYDESGNLISKVEGTNVDPKASVWKYAYKKDSDNRLIGWTVERTTSSGAFLQEYLLKYYSDGRVLIYSEGERHANMIVPSEAFRKNLLSTSNLTPGEGIFEETDTLWNDTDPKSEFYGLPSRSDFTPKTGYLTVFSGEIDKDILTSDTWFSSTEEYMKNNRWYYLFVTFNKDGKMTGEYSTSGGDGYSYSYTYDSDNRLTATESLNFDEHEICNFSYDKKGRLIERSTDFTLSDTGYGSAHTKTSYHYTYDEAGNLTGMTSETIDLENKSAKISTRVLTVLPTYRADLNVEYGDLTKYFDMTAAQVIAKINQPYEYVYYGTEFLYEDTGLIRFNDEVSFRYEDCTENFADFDKHQKTLIIGINNNGHAAPAKEIGNKLNSAMTYSEIKKIMGDALSGEDKLSDEYGVYMGAGCLGGYRYVFWWTQDPTKNDVAPSEIDFSKEGIGWLFSNSIKEYIKASLTENAGFWKLGEHQETLRKTLGDAYKDVPIATYDYLGSTKFDTTHIDLYESAVYGHPVQLNATDYTVGDPDPEISVFQYTVIARYRTPGGTLETYTFPQDPIVLDANGNKVTEPLYSSFSRIVWSDDVPDRYPVQDIRKTCNIPAVESSTKILEATVTRFSEDGLNETFTTAYYVNGTEPSLTCRYICDLTNNGGRSDWHFFGPDGKEITDLTSFEKIEEGTETVESAVITWEKRKLNGAEYILHINYAHESGWSEVYDYLVVNGCIMQYFSQSSN
ncbi:MAG: hypothetical protein IK055_02430, partial [Lachnospiraceae bacterium]|nr:hypothetical protein [Lachnospiraceae bacterium]